MTAAVELDALSKTFAVPIGRGLFRPKRDFHAVRDVSFRVSPGESLAFIGPNGAGKSTTIKMLTGILHPSSGTARVLGLVPWRDRRRLAFEIGAVFGQRSQLWYHLPPRDTFDLLSKVYGLEAAACRSRRDHLIDRFELASFLDVPVRKLSLGQRMRAEVAASLLHRPKVLFLDEPTIGLDVVARQKLRQLLNQWNREDGLTLFLTSHDAGDIEQLARRVIVIDKGTVAFDGEVTTLRRQHVVGRVLEVKFSAHPKPVSEAGLTVLGAGEFSMRLGVDLSLSSVERAIHAVLQAGPVADIAIQDPPLEAVIAHLYGAVST